MKRSLHAVKSVAKILSPLILSFITVFCGFLFLKNTVSGTLGAAGLFLADEPFTPVFNGRDIFEGYSGPADQAQTIDLNDIVFPRIGDKYARLSIPSCGIEDDVYFDDSDEALRRGLGQYTGSRIPGYGEPILIGGHNNHAFHTLGNAAVGDVITITTNYGVFEYRIVETKIRRADDRAAMEAELTQDKEQLILYTCYPFTTLSLTPDRYFVYADKVSGPVLLY